MNKQKNMNLLLVDGLNNTSAITTLNRKYYIDEKFLLFASILKNNQIEFDYFDFANVTNECIHISANKSYLYAIINTNIKNIHIIKDVADKINAKKIICISFDKDFSSLFYNDKVFYIYFGNDDNSDFENLFSLLNLSVNYNICDCTNFSLINDLSDRNVFLNTYTGFNNNIIKNKKNILFIISEIESILKMGVKNFHIKNLFIDQDYDYIVNFSTSVSKLREKYDFFYSCNINFPEKCDIDKLFILLFNSGLQKVIISLNRVDNKETIIKSIRKLIKYGIINIHVEIPQIIDFTDQKDWYQDFIEELINCSNGLVDITFNDNELYLNIESKIEYDNWVIDMNKKIRSAQKKLYHNISLQHRHQIALLAKYGIFSQLYMSIVHKSKSLIYLDNRFIYFSYTIKDNLLDYIPIISSRTYFDSFNNTHIHSDVDFYADKKELIYDEKVYNFFILLLKKLTLKEIFKEIDKKERKIFMNLIKELEYNNCLIFIKYII